MSPITRAVPRVKISSPTVFVWPLARTTTVFEVARQSDGAFFVTKKLLATERAVAHVTLVAVRLFRAA
jgi:hypothetical protein